MLLTFLRIERWVLNNMHVAYPPVQGRTYPHLRLPFQLLVNDSPRLCEWQLLGACAQLISSQSLQHATPQILFCNWWEITLVALISFSPCNAMFEVSEISGAIAFSFFVPQECPSKAPQIAFSGCTATWQPVRLRQTALHDRKARRSTYPPVQTSFIQC